ncbi:MAG: protease modulator HflC [Deltaproteobacteria bacterium]|nr:protease modulator HflC [Deltaproteobacteria bacterium]
MMDRKAPLVVALTVLVGLFLVLQAAFVVDQTERAIVLQLGKPVSGMDEGLEPGLHFKIPFVQNVVFFDHRLLEYDAPAAEILTLDKKNLVVDNFTRWRIKNPLLFYETLNNIDSGQARLNDIIYAELRVALGRFTLTEVVASERSGIMEEVTARTHELLKDYGIEVIDVRIKRTDLPPENRQAIFGRMRAERERQAKQYRSEGREEAAKITTGADRERTVLLAEARRKAQELKGDGDANATEIFAKALSQDPEFYAFQKSLEAYREGFRDKTEFVFTPDNQFLRYLEKDTP